MPTESRRHATEPVVPSHREAICHDSQQHIILLPLKRATLLDAWTLSAISYQGANQHLDVALHRGSGHDRYLERVVCINFEAPNLML
ncbi:hypothetical protein LshimejAT787_1100490 [Lyophyllum shimeji]|uniref:Uncharacterized protein n=1 Tax=Lyophyllum shimeji TaxID=47721 RepID=A0A9P3PV00_LYOSH|nr:hypothetical protein LshimejAT787_1100490 [Lyophyllum shimeji]